MTQDAPRVAAAVLTRAVECQLVSPRMAIDWLDVEARGRPEFIGLARQLSVYGDRQLSSYLVEMSQMTTGALMDLEGVAVQMEQDPALLASRQAASMAVSSDLFLQLDQDDFWRDAMREDDDGLEVLPLVRVGAGAAAIQEEEEDDVFDPVAEEPFSMDGDPWHHEVVDRRDGPRERHEGEAKEEMSFLLAEVQAGEEQEAKSVALEVMKEANCFLFAPGEGGEESDSNLHASASSLASPMTPPLSLSVIRSKWCEAREKEKRSVGTAVAQPSGWIQEHRYTRHTRVVAEPLCDGTSAACACEEHRSGRAGAEGGQ